MKLIKKWNDISLVKRIIGGLIFGIVLGLVFPKALAIGILGDLFVGALKALAPILVFFLVMHSLSKHEKGKSSNMKKIIMLYLIGTLLAAFTAVAASFIFPSTLTLTDVAEGAAPDGIGEVLKTVLMNAVSNPIGAMVDANYMGVLLWAVIFGLALRSASDNTKDVLGNISDALSSAIKWVISFAPFGILGLVYTTVATVGIEAMASYLRIILILVGCMLVVAFIINPVIVFLNIRKIPILWFLSA